MCVEAHFYVCMCIWRPEVDVMCFLWSVYTIVEGLSLSLELTVLTSLASQFTLGIPSLLLPNARTTGVCGVMTPWLLILKKILF